MTDLDEEAQEYHEYLDGLVKLPRWIETPFSILLMKGDPTAYDIGFEEWVEERTLWDSKELAEKQGLFKKGEEND